jgi:predicted mannosyl-3-phosphoglycerate phosphatase (HAD superfamily)
VIPIVVFSDVDAAMIDGATGSARAAELLSGSGDQLEIVVWSSYTRVEIIHRLNAMGVACAFVCEDGSAAFIPETRLPVDVPGSSRRDGYHQFQFGYARRDVRRVLKRVALDVEVPVLTFSDMSSAEVSAACGITLPQAERARCREYGERFRLLGDDWEGCARLFPALAVNGIRALYDPPFHRAVGAVDRRQSFTLLRLLYRQMLGDVLTVSLIDQFGKQSPLAIADCLIVAGEAMPDAERLVSMCVPPVATADEWAQGVTRIVDGIRADPRRYAPLWRGQLTR